MKQLQLATIIPPQIRRVLVNSEKFLWLRDPLVDISLKACLLNILAVMCIRPSVKLPIIEDVGYVFDVKAERIYAAMNSGIEQKLVCCTKEMSLPFYEDPHAPLAVHLDLLIGQEAFKDATLRSFRAEGAPSLQVVLASSTLNYTIADIDLDEHNPLQDVVGFVEHMHELRHITDHVKMYETLKQSEAAPYLCYSLVG